MPCLGLIADTHGYLDPQVRTHFADVEHILHAGDIGWPSLLLELRDLAPVTAVAGNTDSCQPHLREVEVLDCDGRRLLLQHIVNPHRLTLEFRRSLAALRPDVVVFGHTHRPFHEVIDGVLFVNPGSAGQGRQGHPRSLARLEWAPSMAEFQLTFIELGP